MTTGERMKSRRKKLGLSADDVAQALGVSRATVFRYEKGDIEKVPGAALEPLAKVLHTSVAYLMGWDEPAAPAPLSPTTENLTANDANAFFQYLSSLGYFVRYDEDKIGYHIISDDKTVNLFLSPEDFKRAARTSDGMLKVMLDSLRSEKETQT